MSRILVNNHWVASRVGDSVVMEMRTGGHRQTYVLTATPDGSYRLTVTVRGVTEEIAMPRLRQEEKAA